MRRQAPLGTPLHLERELYSRDFLLPRPLLRAVETDPSVLLIDEVDRADDEFEAFLLEVLADYSITVPELGTFRAAEATGRGPDLQPDPGRARRAQAAVLVSLGRPALATSGRSRSSANASPK